MSAPNGLTEAEVIQLAREEGILRDERGSDPAHQVSPMDDRPTAVDVCDLADGTGGSASDWVVRDLITERSIIGITGEEGEGKTLLVEQLIREMLRGDPVFGMFEPGDPPPRCVLLIDTEQEQPEIERRVSEMNLRLPVEPQSFYWVCAGGLEIARSADDQRYIEREIERTGSNFLWIDSASNAVDDPKDDGSTRAFFNYLSELMRTFDLRAVGLTMHPRKRAQGEYGRRFDDLFGSREWKGRATTVLYIDGSTVIAWKDRARGLYSCWPQRAQNRYPKAVLRRPGLTDSTGAPFIVEPGEAEQESDKDALEARAMTLVADRPDHYTKSALARAVGGRKERALDVVDRLIASGRIGPDTPRARLVVQEGSPDGLL